jgi:hypothetical protein
LTWIKKISQSEIHPDWGDISWPIRPEWGGSIHSGDTPPRLSEGGDYIVYHGTSLSVAKLIIQSRNIKLDDIGSVGITTTPSAAGVFASFKNPTHKGWGLLKQPVKVANIRLLEKPYLDGL